MTDALDFTRGEDNVPDLVVACRALNALEAAVQRYHRPTVWDVAAPILLREIQERLVDVRQLLHAAAELDATAVVHSPYCDWQPGGRKAT